ncbi:LPXTG cell wall anchor domain-containing protein [Fictibacillus nanhaiensis]|uniref:LPXTG cell wall anchor domain-containing protein n=1 Tax=Fictibacillus nanhaiensis TaxID=742169 RepID=A0ABS2ZM69_9BACL|nr:LPXTG cell wall anchor domain-containing protein [Fictibacillus nanhaiensis]
MNLHSNRFKFLIMYCCVLLTAVVFVPLGHTGANSSSKEIEINTLPKDVIFAINNFKPGDWATRVLAIQNNGNQDFSYSLKAQKKSGSNKLYNQFVVKVEDQSEIIYRGSLKEFTGLKPRSLKSGLEEKLTVTVEFPYESSNEFQGFETEVELIVFAEGTAKPPATDGEDNNHPTKDNGGGSPGKKPTANGAGSLPQTGEENPLILILSGLFISLAGFGLLLSKKFTLSNLFKRG